MLLRRPSLICFACMRSKDQVRRAVWRAMDREGVSRFPGAEGRVPNFAGAKLAAEKLAQHRLWKRAQVIKTNPDSPQTHARRLALEQGKKLVMAVPASAISTRSACSTRSGSPRRR